MLEVAAPVRRRYSKNGMALALADLPTADCVLWTAYVGPDGYGRSWDGTRSIMAHRLVYIRTVGPIPAGLELDHLCRVRSCVNPKHLEPVTAVENNRRSMPFRNSTRAEQCVKGHPFDEANTYVLDDRRRNCRTCNRAAAARYAAKKKTPAMSGGYA